MPVRHVVASGGSTNGDGISPNPPITFARALVVATAGDTVKMATGSYGNGGAPFNFPNSGTGDSDSLRIIFEPEPGATATITDQLNLDGRSYVTIRNLFLESDGHALLETDNTSAWLNFDNCTWDSESPSSLSDPAHIGITFTFYGIMLRGTRHRFRDNTLQKWYGGDWLQAFGSHHLISGTQGKDAVCGHGVLMNYASYTVLQNNDVANLWSRMGENAGKDTTEELGNVVQGNTCYHMGWDGSTQTYGWSQAGDGPGDANLAKFCSSRLIYRNNLWVAPQQNPNTIGGEMHRNVHQVTNYDAFNRHMRNMRVYHNTYYNCEQHVFAATYNQNLEMYAENNAFLNNVAHAIATSPDGRYNASFWLRATGVTNGPANGQTNYSWMTTWQIRNNLLNRPIRHGITFQGTLYNASAPNDYGTSTNSTKGLYTVAEFEAAFARATGNVDGAPTFVNATYNYASTAWIVRDNFTLASGNGKAAARHLATITAGSSGTRITLDDAYAFTDGNDGVIEGDRLIITGALGHRTTQVTNWVSATQLDISPAITVQAGDLVWLEAFGANPDMGIAASSSTSSVAAPVLAHAEQGSTTQGNTIASPTFTPPAEATLLVIATANGVTSGVTILPATISDSWNINWTTYSAERGTTGSRVAIAIFVGRTGLSPAAGSYTVTWTNSPGSKALNAAYIASGFATPPVVQNVTNDAGAVSSLVVTLPTAPAATSLVIGVIAVRANSPDPTGDADFTQLEETIPSTTHAQHIQYAYGQQAMEWTGAISGAGVVAIALEIAEGLPVPTMEGAGNTTLSALTASGTASFSAPAHDASASVTLPALTASSTGSFAQAFYQGSAVVTLPALTATATGTHETVVVTGAGDATLSALTGSGAAIYTVPEYDASATVTLPAFVLAAVGVFSTSLFSGASATTLPALSASAAGEHVAPSFDATADWTLPFLTATGTGAYSDSTPILFMTTAEVEI